MPFISRFTAGQLARPSQLFGRFLGTIWNRRNQALNDAAFDLLALQPDDRVLEIGFGGGYLLERMARVLKHGCLAGVDDSPAMVKYAKKRMKGAGIKLPIDLKRAPAESLPFPEAHFTAVCSVNSIFYWQQIDKGLAEIKRVLSPKGRLVLCFTTWQSLEDKPFARHLTPVEPEDIREKLLRNGFSDVQISRLSDPYRQFVSLHASV